MENTNDKSFIRHNSDKPFIRTMEDDLKKIKNSPVGNDGIGSAISSLVSASSRADTSRKETSKEPNRPISTPVSPVPKNLPVDEFFVKKNPKAEINKEASKPIEKPEDIVNSSKRDNQITGMTSLAKDGLTIEKKSVLGAGLAPAETVAMGGKEKVISASRSIPLASPNAFSRRPRNTQRMIEESENLSPEARLARQSSSGIGASDTEFKESLAVPPSAGVSSNVPGYSGKFARSADLAPSMPTPFNTEKTRTEEIIKIKEESPNYSFEKIIRLLFAVLIIFGIGIGAYYLYIAKKPIANPVPANIPSNTFIMGITEATINADLNADLNNDIKSFFSNAKPSGIYRLIIKDKDGQNIMELENFKKGLNITLPDYVTNVLEEDYNLIVFNYPEKNYLRMGLVFKPKSSSDIPFLIRSWEPEMYGSVRSIFLEDYGIYEAGKQFGANKRNNFDVRYLPLGSENIALNYAIDNEKKFLLIATSKEDIFNLIDKIIKGK